MSDEADTIKEVIKYPVKYDNGTGYFFDANDDVIAEVRGFGRFQYMEEGTEKMDVIGYFIANAINEKLIREKR